MNVFLAGFPLAGRTVVVTGEGEAADAKARLFDGSPATVVRVPLADALRPERYAGAHLVFLALPEDLAIKAAEVARAVGALVNVVDRPQLCDFTTPALVDRGRVVGAIATGGAAPVLAAELRQQLEAAWPERLGAVAELIEALRDEARDRLADASARRAVLRDLVRGAAGRAAVDGDMAAALRLGRQALERGAPRAAQVLRLQAPQEPGRLTLDAVRALGAADRVVADAGVSRAVLAYARRDAQRVILAPTHASDDLGWLIGARLIVRVTQGPAEAEAAALKRSGAEVTDLAAAL